MIFIIIQLIGALGFCFLSLSYYKENKKMMLFFQIIALSFFSIHFFLLDGFAGGICNLIQLISLITIFLLDKYSLKYKLYLSLIFIMLIIIINLINYQNIYSIFPIISSTIVIVSFINNKKSENFIRITGFISALCWLTYALAYKSYISIIFEIITLTNISISLFKKNNN